MTSKREFIAAKNAVGSANCFFGSDTMLYGIDWAKRQLKESEERLRQVASQCILEGVVGFIPKMKTVPLNHWVYGLYDPSYWEVYAYSDYGTNGVPRYAELRERI